MFHDTAIKKERWKDTTRLSKRGTYEEGVSFLPRCVLPTSLSCLGRVRIWPWGTSPCGCLGHSNKAYVASNFLLNVSSLCYSSYLLHPCPSLRSLGCSSSDTWQRLAEVGKAEAWFGSSHTSCHSGHEKFIKIKSYQPWGGQRWSRQGSRSAHVVRTESVGRISPQCRCGHLKPWVCCSVVSCPWNLILCYTEAVLRVGDNGILHQNAVCVPPSRLMHMQNLHKIIKNH